MHNSRTFRWQFTPLLMIFLITAYFISSVANRLQAGSQTLGLVDLINGIGWLLLVIVRVQGCGKKPERC